MVIFQLIFLLDFIPRCVHWRRDFFYSRLAEKLCVIGFEIVEIRLRVGGKSRFVGTRLTEGVTVAEPVYVRRDFSRETGRRGQPGQVLCVQLFFGKPCVIVPCRSAADDWLSFFIACGKVQATKRRQSGTKNCKYFFNYLFIPLFCMSLQVYQYILSLWYKKSSKSTSIALTFQMAALLSDKKNIGKEITYLFKPA